MSLRRVRQSLSDLSRLAGASLCGLRGGEDDAWDDAEGLFFGPWRAERVCLAFPEPVTRASALLLPRIDADHCVHLGWGAPGALGCVLDGPLWAGEPLHVVLPAGWHVEGIGVDTKVCVPEPKAGSGALWAGAVGCGVVAARRPPCLLSLTHGVPRGALARD